LLLSPWFFFKILTTRKYRRGLWPKFLGATPVLSPRHPVTPSPRYRVWFHGVSVGEIHLLRQVIARFRQRHPDWDCVISTTTDTGLDEARKRFPDLPVFWWPLDFSWAVRRALRRVQPSLVVLAESELWPNFLLAAKRHGVPVAVINGRMSPRSLRRYRRLGALARWLFGHVDLLAMQNEDYAANVRKLADDPERVRVTGNVKYDGVETDRGNARTEELRQLLHVRAEELVWAAGSTQAPEEEIALDIYRRARTEHPHLRLFLVPRQRDRFDAVAGLLRRSGVPFLRRSAITYPLDHPVTSSPRHPVILVDTIGELGALWGLADIAFVGGSLDGRRGGQNMIEPAAYGSAVVFGPHVWNFRRDAANLVMAGGAVQVADAERLELTLRRLLNDAAERERLGKAARRFVLQQQGATERTLDLLDELLLARQLRDRRAA
jgi:3-deoxy-D-manno-octulosonic-acid transferase